MAFSLTKLFDKKPASPIDYLVVGLGNPGKEYEQTRHNMGFMAIDKFALKMNVKLDRLKWKALTGTAQVGEKKLLLLKPQTFMNLSGEAVAEAARFYKVPPERILVLFDDVSLDVGKLRIRRKGSDGGQKGMRSIIQCMGSEEIPRIKIGVGAKPHPDYDMAAWVLSHFSKAELKVLEETTDRVAEAVKVILTEDIGQAMNRYNG